MLQAGVIYYRSSDGDFLLVEFGRRLIAREHASTYVRSRYETPEQGSVSDQRGSSCELQHINVQAKIVGYGLAVMDHLLEVPAWPKADSKLCIPSVQVRLLAHTKHECRASNCTTLLRKKLS